MFAAAQIYNMLKNYTGKVNVKIDGLAASAASVIAMAGDEVMMSPVSMLMIHNPVTVAIGDSKEMQKAIEMLDEVKESIINAYELKTGLSRARISHLMDSESWFNAKKAVELGFADKIMFSDENENEEIEAVMFSRQAVTNSLLAKLSKKSDGNEKDSNGKNLNGKDSNEIASDNKVPVIQLEKRLNLLRN